jgi:hypothetical protein
MKSILASEEYLTVILLALAAELVALVVRSAYRWRLHQPLSHRKIRKLRTTAAEPMARDPVANAPRGRHRLKQSHVTPQWIAPMLSLRAMFLVRPVRSTRHEVQHDCAPK